MSAPGFPESDARLLVERALEEDLDSGTDVTTTATIPPAQQSVAHLVARAPGVVAGLPVVGLVLDAVAARLGSGRVAVEAHVADGSRVVRGDHLTTLRGATRTTLVAERTILNILCRTSGVATHTRRWADLLEGTGARVLDTRKTTPGMRALEKYAVRCGGGTNKRMGLYDVAMVKDNHKLAAGGLTAAWDAIASGSRASRSRSRSRPPPRRSRQWPRVRGSCCATTCPRTCCAGRCWPCGAPASRSRWRRRAA